MKKIAWITPTCFIDVDLPIINHLCKAYKISWYIIVSSAEEMQARQLVGSLLTNKHSLQYDFHVRRSRQRSIKSISFLYNILKSIKAGTPDLIYTSEYAMPYGIFLYKLMLDKNISVAACHNVNTPKGATNENFARRYMDMWLKTFKNIQTFSESQCKLLNSLYSNKNVLMALLALKDYGEPTIEKPNINDCTNFLFFGNIVNYKRVDLLLNAVDILAERGIRNFKVTIAGNCKTWEKEYGRLVHHPELVNLKIQRVPNEDVANLFANNHYFVMPYQDIAQSGAITVAFRYNIPPLVSDIEQFEEFVTDGITGYTFKSGDAVALADKMEYLIKEGAKNYDIIRRNEQDFTDNNLSIDIIINKYKTYFDSL